LSHSQSIPNSAINDYQIIKCIYFKIDAIIHSHSKFKSKGVLKESKVRDRNR